MLLLRILSPSLFNAEIFVLNVQEKFFPLCFNHIVCF